MSRLSKRGNIYLAVAGMSGILLIVVAFFATGIIQMNLEGYSSGWEVRSKLDSIYIANQHKWYDMGTAPLGDIPWSDKSVQFDPTDPNEYEKWDFVQEPDIFVSVDDPIHTTELADHTLPENSAGEVTQTALDQYSRELMKDVQGERLFYYHHVYAYTVTVKTDVDRSTDGLIGWQAYLETKGEEGVPLQFTVRTSFSVTPWNIVGTVVSDDDGDRYTVSTGFAGVMSASIATVRAGFSDRTLQARLEENGRSDVLATINTGWEIEKPIVHDPAPMWISDDQRAKMNEVPESLGVIKDVPNSVLIDFSGKLYPGADQATLGEWAALPIGYDLFMQVTLRVDVVCCTGYTPIAGTDPLPEPPIDDKVGPAPFLYPLASMLASLWAENYIFVVAIVAVVFVVLALIVVTRLKVLFWG